MLDNLTEIVSLKEVEAFTWNDEIEEMCSSNPSKVQKIINQITAKIWAKINKDQFLDNGVYYIPDDLKIATVWLIDSFYVYTVKNWQSVATWKKTSYKETIDDYSVSETYSTESKSAFDYFWIPIDQYSLIILMSYMDDDVWFWNVNLH